MNLIYPEPETSVYIPVDLDGRMGEVVFEAVHRQPGSTIHWHVDRQYIASTRYFHQVSLNPNPGDHLLILTDQEGRRLERRFRVINPERREP
jgi:penicillin-binding protein 1C